MSRDPQHSVLRVHALTTGADDAWLESDGASNYGYDQIYELLSTTQGGTTTESYTYDPVGNRLSSLGLSTYQYNVSNELTQTPNTIYAQDANGNTTIKTDSTGSTTYTWNYENRLTSVTLPGSGGTVTFKYDPLGHRIQKSFTQPGSPPTTTTTNYAYDWDNLVDEVDASGNVVAKYAQTQNIDEPLAESRSGTTSYYEADGLGSVTSLSNGTGPLAQTYTYDSFGKLTASSGSITNPFRYTAREFDIETNLYYYRARYYDPASGRFLSEDPLESNSDDLNLYRYVRNLSTGNTDPQGCGGKTIDCGGGCGFRIERDQKGLHINWWCNGATGCFLYPSYQPCEVGKSYEPPARLIRCVQKHFPPVPVPAPAPQFCWKEWWEKYHQPVLIGGAIVVAAGAIALAPLTGGQSLWGLAWAL